MFKNRVKITLKGLKMKTTFCNWIKIPNIFMNYKPIEIPKVLKMIKNVHGGSYGHYDHTRTIHIHSSLAII